MNRKCNSGPYIVRWDDLYGFHFSKECHTWKYACDTMREKIIAGMNNVSVEFA